MRTFGLIGYPLGHSFSKKFFNEKFEKECLSCIYENFELPSLDLLREVLNNHTELVGLNVTIPYKEKIIPFLNETDPSIAEIGSVNTIKVSRKEDGSVCLKGFNTDVYGFGGSLKPLLKAHHKKALILGTGGASKAVAWTLRQLNIEYRFVSRNSSDCILGYDQLSQSLIEEYTLIVNTTPLGTYPKTDACPDIPYQFITPDHLLYDLVYNPEVTLFLKKGQERGAAIKNGLEMLHLQALKSWEIWNSK